MEDEYIPDYDEDADIGIPSAFTQRAMLSSAVVKASRMQQELTGQIDGMLAEYVQFALNESAEAAARLLTMHPKDERELFELQKKAAPFAAVLEWMRLTARTAISAQQQIDDITQQGEVNEQSE